MVSALLFNILSLNNHFKRFTRFSRIRMTEIFKTTQTSESVTTEILVNTLQEVVKESTEYLTRAEQRAVILVKPQVPHNPSK